MGFLNFIKKDKKEQKKDNLPITLITENVNKSLADISKNYNIPLSSLDFDILSYKTYIKRGKSDFVELDKGTKNIIEKEEFLTNEENEIKQVYEIKVKKAQINDNLGLIGDMQINENCTLANYILKPGSSIVYNPKLKDQIKTELNKKKLRNSLLINLLDSDMEEDIKKVTSKIKILDSLEKEEIIRLCKGIDPLPSIEGKIVYHYLKQQDPSKKELIYPVKKGDILIEIIKPKSGKSGRNCRGKIIKTPKLKEFHPSEIKFDSSVIKKEENENRIIYKALKSGYIYKKEGIFTIKDGLEVKHINLKSGNINNAKEANVKLEIKGSNRLKDAIGDNMVVETTFLKVNGNIGSSAKINAKEVAVQGQTHKKAFIKADKAFINIHKGKLEAKEVEINRLENGFIKAQKVKINQAIGGEIIAQEIEIDTLFSNTKIYGLKEIKIKKIKGSENYLAISPLKVIGGENNVKKIEKKIDDLRRIINLKLKEYNKIKDALLFDKKNIEKLKEIYFLNKQKGITTSYEIIKRIKEYKKMKERAVKLEEGTEILKNEVNILKETLHNLQNIVFNSKITSFSPWVEFNKIEFELIEPPIKLKYNTKGNEGVCGFKLKDFGDSFKIVKIKVENDSRS
ncbi:MAG TPA: DUF342 domain-containing protein [Nautiliaceae bacterium]|nr:DUF342 domain-containing protein [Nautiliaceae bacterium]